MINKHAASLHQWYQDKLGNPDPEDQEIAKIKMAIEPTDIPREELQVNGVDGKEISGGELISLGWAAIPAWTSPDGMLVAIQLPNGDLSIREMEYSGYDVVSSISNGTIGIDTLGNGIKIYWRIGGSRICLRPDGTRITEEEIEADQELHEALDDPAGPISELRIMTPEEEAEAIQILG